MKKDTPSIQEISRSRMIVDHLRNYWICFYSLYRFNANKADRKAASFILFTGRDSLILSSALQKSTQVHSMLRGREKQTQQQKGSVMFSLNSAIKTFFMIKLKKKKQQNKTKNYLLFPDLF